MFEVSSQQLNTMFCLSGKGSSISCDIFPPYDTSDGDYEVGLVNLSTFNSIPNIEAGVNDKFYFGDEDLMMKFDEGSYEIEDIEKYIVNRLPAGVDFSLKANNNTLKTEILCNKRINFSKEGTIAPLLGFSNKILNAGVIYASDQQVNILKVNSIRVECNIVRGSYDNGTEGHVLHEFFPLVEPGYKIVETPGTVIYLPVNVHKVYSITVQLRDQNGDLINLQNETLSVRLHIKKK